MAQIRIPTIDAGTDVIESTDLPLGLATATVTLTNAQIKALPTTPITIIAAPGAGKVILFVAGMLKSDFTAGAYTNVDSYVHGIILQRTAIGPWSTEMLTNAEERYSQLAPYVDPDGNDPPVALVTPNYEIASRENQPVRLDIPNDLGNFTGGHASNSLTVTVLYCVVPV